MTPALQIIRIGIIEIFLQAHAAVRRRDAFASRLRVAAAAAMSVRISYHSYHLPNYNVKKMIIQSLSLSAKPSVSLHPHLIFLLKNEKLIKVR